MNVRDFVLIKATQCIIAVDFDGVLVEDEYPGIGHAIAENIKFVKELKKQGNKIILWTCRSGKQLDDACLFCYRHGIKFDAINSNLPETIEKYGNDSRKITADIYLDDKAYNNLSEEVLK